MADAERKMKTPKTIVLARSGRTVVFDEDYTAVDTIAAQKAAGKDAQAFPLYLAQRVCLFDGSPLTVGQIRDLAGRDYLQLVGELLGDVKENEAGEQGKPA